MKHLDIEHSQELNTFWVTLKPRPVPCMTTQLLDDLIQLPQHIVDYNIYNKPAFMVFQSDVPNVFNLGGDLQLFVECYEQQDWNRLHEYATKCIQALFLVHTGFGYPISTIAVVEGAALGGGMEGILAVDHVAATPGAVFGLPEINYDLLPGMGAYTFLREKLSADKARSMLASGETWTGKDMYDKGLVHTYTHKSRAIDAVTNMIRAKQAKPNATRMLLEMRRMHETVSKRELLTIAGQWATSVRNLTPENIASIKRKIKVQKRMFKEK